MTSSSPSNPYRVSFDGATSAASLEPPYDRELPVYPAHITYAVKYQFLVCNKHEKEHCLPDTPTEGAAGWAAGGPAAGRPALGLIAAALGSRYFEGSASGGAIELPVDAPLLELLLGKAGKSSL